MILDMVRLTVTDPRAMMTALLRLQLPRGAALQLLLLGAVASAMATWAAMVVQPFPDPAVTALVLGYPAAFAVSSVLLSLLFALCLYRVGLALGGLGDLTGSMILIGWLQLVMVGLQLAEIVIVMILPPVIGIVVSLAALGLALWIAINMNMALHRFAGAGAAAAALAGAFVMTILGLVVFSMLLASLAGGGGGFDV